MSHGQIEPQQLTGHNMLVKMITRFAGENGTANPGEEIEVSDKQAGDLIAGGFAVPIKSAAIETAVIKNPENAAVATGKE